MASITPKSPLGSDRAAQQIAALESRIEYLRRKFQMYFNGFDRAAPMTELETLTRDVREFQMTGFNNAQSRFKAQNLVARFTTQRQMWVREIHKREEGLSRGANPVVLRKEQGFEPIDDL